jgi:hypothetical protein
MRTHDTRADTKSAGGHGSYMKTQFTLGAGSELAGVTWPPSTTKTDPVVKLELSDAK